MIQVFSNEFKVKPEQENTLIWFITDVCGLDLHECAWEHTYFFNGLVDGCLTGFGIDKEQAEDLDISKQEYEELEEGIVVVDFQSVFSRLLDSTAIYYEFDISSQTMFATKISSDNIQDFTWAWHDFPTKEAK